jgi:ankyrin repeat protein
MRRIANVERPEPACADERRAAGDDVHSSAMSPDPPGDAASTLTLPHGDPVAVELTRAIHGGDLDALRRLVVERPELATAHMIGRKGLEGGWRTPLHAATDWPAYFPAAPAAVELLLEAGADPNDDTGGGCPETPLHWAASSDDVDVAVVLIDGGADVETPGGSIGTPLDNAIGYGCWHVARLLVERGAPVDALWHAAALGMLGRLEELLAAAPSPTEDAVNNAFWQACHGGQLRAAERLLAAGADINASPAYANNQTALDQAVSPDTRRGQLATWLREHGATSADED